METAQNIFQMAKSLNIRKVAAIANKITDGKQIEQIRLQLGDIPLLTSIELMPAIQAADIARTNVFQAENELVHQLDEAKKDLMSMIIHGRGKNNEA